MSFTKRKMVFIGIYIGNELSFTFRLCGGVKMQTVLSGVQGTTNINIMNKILISPLS